MTNMTWRMRRVIYVAHACVLCHAQWGPYGCTFWCTLSQTQQQWHKSQSLARLAEQNCWLSPCHPRLISSLSSTLPRYYSMTAVEDLWPDVRLLRIQLSTFIFSILCSSHPFLSSFIWAAGIKLSAQMVKISLFYQDAPARCGISNADYALPSPHWGWLESIKFSVLSHVATDVAELMHRNAAEKSAQAVAL